MKLVLDFNLDNKNYCRKLNYEGVGNVYTAYLTKKYYTH